VARRRRTWPAPGLDAGSDHLAPLRSPTRTGTGVDPLRVRIAQSALLFHRYGIATT
jgi:hypothetical protein